MKPLWCGVLLTGLTLFAGIQPTTARAETETIDLKALAKKARPAVLLLVISDAAGKEIATGTGFLVSSDGKLITNHHVIENAASAVAKAENGGLFPVEGVLADDPKNDLVLLKLKGKDLPFLPLGNSENVEAGTRIAIIGSPLGLEGTLSEGIVSAVRELMGDMKLLQVTAAISPGSSGSPVMNAKGDVIGIASALLRSGQSLNFAIPVKSAARLLTEAQSSAMLQPLSKFGSDDGDVIFSDPNYRAALVAEAAGDHAEMLTRVKELVGHHSESALAWCALSVSYDNLNSTNEAIAASQRAIKLKPELAEAWYDLSLPLLRSGRTDDAIDACRQAIKLKSDYAEAWNNLGFAYDKSGRSDDAIAAFRQAIKLKPDYSPAWNNLGFAYGKSGHIDEAIDACRQALRLKPDYAEAWYNLGIVCSQSTRTDEAIEAYRQAIKLRPDFAEAWVGLGSVYGRLRRVGDAIDALRKAVMLKPDYTEAWWNLAIAYGVDKQFDRAREAAEELKKIDPEIARKLSQLLMNASK